MGVPHEIDLIRRDNDGSRSGFCVLILTVCIVLVENAPAEEDKLVIAVDAVDQKVRV